MKRKYQSVSVESKQGIECSYYTTYEFRSGGRTGWVNEFTQLKKIRIENGFDLKLSTYKKEESTIDL